MVHGVKNAGLLAALLLALIPAGAMAAQGQADRADPSRLREEMTRQEQAAPSPTRQPIHIQSAEPASPGAAAAIGSVLVGAVHVEGAVALPPGAFGAAIEPFLGRQ